LPPIEPKSPDCCACEALDVAAICRFCFFFDDLLDFFDDDDDDELDDDDDDDGDDDEPLDDDDKFDEFKDIDELLFPIELGEPIECKDDDTDIDAEPPPPMSMAPSCIKKLDEAEDTGEPPPLVVH
jgi:hypothetical protein